jgi:hypothetical protein
VRAKRARRPWSTYKEASRGLKGRNRCAVFRPFRAGR